MSLSLESLLFLAAVAHFVVFAAGLAVPLALDWKSGLAAAPAFLRRLFWVYGGFISLTVVGLGVLALVNVDAIAAGVREARALAGFIAIFWGARLAVGVFVFDPEELPQSPLLKAGHWALNLLIAGMTLVFGYAALQG